MSAVRSSQYTCAKCLQYFSTRDLLIRHVFSHLSLLLNIPLHICQNSGQIFSNQSKLYDHHFEETKETTFKQPSLIGLACAFCADTFLSWCSLTKHVFTHVSAISAPLDVCTYYFEDLDDMTKLHFHKSNSKISQRRYYYGCQCNSPKHDEQIPATKHVENCMEDEPISWNCYSKRLRFKYKYVSETTQSDEDPTVNIISEFSYCLEKCQKVDSSNPLLYKACDHAFTNHGNLEGHQATHSSEIPIWCEIWKKSLRNSMHLKSQNGIHLYKRPFHCKFCGKSFTEFGSLTKQERVHLDEWRFSCEVCGKSFKKSHDLKIHKWIHLGERPYSCEFCGKCFTQSGNLKRHKRIHLGERPFSCDVCGKSFTESGVLKKHKLIHTGERPFSCIICGNCFTQSSNLKGHMRIHTGERPYGCEICGKSFTESGSLKKHKRIHLGERPYSCKDCGKSFTESGSLNKHKWIHLGERPSSCNICGKSFTGSRSLKRHKQIHSG